MVSTQRLQFQALLDFIYHQMRYRTPSPENGCSDSMPLKKPGARNPKIMVCIGHGH
jgi:hypothetical protein